ncbi:MAG: hypothetical protein COZ16_12290 [Flavobacteriaceae bacterium CG_4_10_14_3_um_filter_31_253]|nr:MAG: hypothetical protein COZ16_12290 [Flavobacteriaceae bacterium CG_4_10_14_3_um_filter_31_253]
MKTREELVKRAKELQKEKCKLQGEEYDDSEEYQKRFKEVFDEMHKVRDKIAELDKKTLKP